MNKPKSPYSLGFNGHAKVCDCPKCAKARAYAIGEANWKTWVYEKPRPKPDATIFVRAHFRRGKHLTKMPNTLKALRQRQRNLWSARQQVIER